VQVGHNGLYWFRRNVPTLVFGGLCYRHLIAHSRVYKLGERGKSSQVTSSCACGACACVCLPPFVGCQSSLLHPKARASYSIRLLEEENNRRIKGKVSDTPLYLVTSFSRHLIVLWFLTCRLILLKTAPYRACGCSVPYRRSFLALMGIHAGFNSTVSPVVAMHAPWVGCHDEWFVRTVHFPRPSISCGQSFASFPIP
jgi:hypothetical protein